jgi:hypothetical protein
MIASYFNWDMNKTVQEEPKHFLKMEKKIKQENLSKSFVSW